MLTSSEFIALCRAQIIILTQALGASLSVLYLTQEMAEGTETQLIPIMAYPESAIDWQAQGTARSLMSATSTIKMSPPLLANSQLTRPQTKQLPGASSHQPTASTADAATDWLNDSADRRLHPNSSNSSRSALVTTRRVVLPLMHEDVVLGLLVTERNDRPWTEWEQAQIHQIVDTLAIACVLDQRYQWLKQDHRQQLQLQEQQHDLLDNLLHQFRNSLTTLQTFGKLILKRLLPEDGNREIAASLVRETTRLRDLATQLEIAAAGEPINMPSLALPPAIQERQLGNRTTDDNATLRQGIRRLPLLPAAGFLSGTPLALEPCKLSTVLEPLLASASAIAHDRALKLITDIPDDLPPVQAEPQMLREVLSNVIDNALKYTPAGGLVLVQANMENVQGQTLEHERQAVEIAITDTGPGIPHQDLQHLFERHYRGVQAQTEIPGTGLGLSIARALITQMCGEIHVFSPAQTSRLGQGLTDALATQEPGTTVVVQLAVSQSIDPT